MLRAPVGAYGERRRPPGAPGTFPGAGSATIIIPKLHFIYCVRPYHVENTSSRPITAVKHHWAVLVLGWVTAWEYTVLYSFLTTAYCPNGAIDVSGVGFCLCNISNIGATADYQSHYLRNSSNLISSHGE